MRSYKDARAMAKSLRDLLAVKNVSLSRGECLEIVAQQFGFADWNTLSSKLGDDEHRPAWPKGTHGPAQPADAAPPPTALGIERLPVIPLRDIVVYPGVVIPIFAGRAKTLRAADEAMRAERRVLLVLQREPQVSNPTGDDLYRIGTLATFIEESEFRTTAEPSFAESMPSAITPGSTRRILVKGLARARVDMLYVEDHLSAHITVLNDDQPPENGELQLVKAAVMTRFEKYAERTGWPPKAWNAPPRADILGMLGGFDMVRLTDMIAAHIPLQLAQKQEVLEMLDVGKRLEYLDDATRRLEQSRPAAKP